MGRKYDSKTRLYSIYQGIKQRCYNKKNGHYKRYGARGIAMCDEWKNDFAAFRDWALANGYTDELTIDRIDNDGNYCPENCQWLTSAENSRKANGGECKEHLLSDLRQYREKAGLSQKELAHRAGVAQADISKIERGNLNTTYKTLERIAAALNLQVKIKFISNDT